MKANLESHMAAFLEIQANQADMAKYQRKLLSSS